MSDLSIVIEDVACSSGNNTMVQEPTHLGTEIGSPSQPPSGRRPSPRIQEPPHDVADEELMHNRFYGPAIQQAFRDAKVLMSDLTAVLGSGSLQIGPDSTMQRLHREAEKLASFQYTSSRTVGFVGDSGVGALLHKGDLSTNLTSIPPRQEQPS